MNPAFPTPAPASAAPHVGEFGAPSESRSRPPVRSRDREKSPDFAELYDQASASGAPRDEATVARPADAKPEDSTTSQSSPDAPESEIEADSDDARERAATSADIGTLLPPDAVAVAPALAPGTGIASTLTAEEISAAHALLATPSTRENFSTMAQGSSRAAAATSTPTPILPSAAAAVVTQLAAATANPTNPGTGAANPATPAIAAIPATPVAQAGATPATPAIPATPAMGTIPGATAETPAATLPAAAAETAAAAIQAARGSASRPGAAQVSGQQTGVDAIQVEGEQKHSLVSGEQPVKIEARSVGTDGALQGDTMKFAPQFAPRAMPASEPGTRASAQQGGADAEFWKGWTNGGGERSSTAAQFSRFADHPLVSVSPASAASAHAARPAATAPAAAPAPAYPTHESALLAPISAAIERIITRGPEQLSLVVRFEQGGSLSLQLSMRDGSIATHMQTDVPGLEAALRSSWNSFAQDWNQRGVKLAAPSFSSDSNPDFMQGQGRDGQRSPQHEAHAFADATPAFGAAMGRRSWRGDDRRADPDSASATLARKIDRPRHAERGLSTWA